MKLTTQASNTYKKLYPNLTIEQIIEEVKKFEETLLADTTIDQYSSNYNKYLRGWMMRANAEAGKNERER